MNDYEKAKQLVMVMLKGNPTPTPDEIKSTVSRVCSMLDASGRQLGFSEDALFVEIETLVNVWIGRATTLDDPRDHQEWLPSQ
jgi:hypothetical protein